MPELPDVETYRRCLADHVLKHRIKQVETVKSPVLKVSPGQLEKAMVGVQFTKAERIGKYILLLISSGQVLVIHFGMTGEVICSGGQQHTPGHTQMVIHFDNDDYLAYTSIRKLGEIALTDNIVGFLQEKKLGPDALSVSKADFVKLLKQKKGFAKAVLMDQAFIAGIGNTYSDEILFQSKLHPRAKVEELNKRQIENLYNNMQEVLKRAIKCEADPMQFPSGFLIPQRKKDSHCPRCNTPLEIIKMSGRSAYFCPKCQQ